MGSSVGLPNELERSNDRSIVRLNVREKFRKNVVRPTTVFGN